MPWLREGECPPERCGGHCCEHQGVWFTDASPEVKSFLKAAQVRGMSVKGNGTDFLLDLEHRCQHLTAGGLCGLYGQPERPGFCQSWPTEPSQLVNDPGCGFTFRWVDEEIPIHG